MQGTFVCLYISRESLEGMVRLMMVGRRANVNGVGLEAAGVKFTRHGVTIDDCLATSNPDIFAVGDVCLREKFTHMAGETGLSCLHTDAVSECVRLLCVCVTAAYVCLWPQG